jgi:hypothetical protein
MLNNYFNIKNIPIGGGGFVTGIIYSQAKKGLTYIRTDVGGAYFRFNAKQNWIPLLDWLSIEDSNLHGIESIACDPYYESRVYIAAGTYQQPWVGNGEILKSDDYGKNWKRIKMPFQMGANEAGRNSGERLCVDPLNNAHLLFGTRQNGLWRSRNFGEDWEQIPSFPVTFETNVSATIKEAQNRYDYNYQALGIIQILFNKHTGIYNTTNIRKTFPVCKEIFALVSRCKNGVMKSTDGGQSWYPLANQPEGLRPTCIDICNDSLVYIGYSLYSGPNTMGPGALWVYDNTFNKWHNITPERRNTPTNKTFFLDKSGNTSIKEQESIRKHVIDNHLSIYGISSVCINPQNPSVILCSTWNRGPNEEIFISYNKGKTWRPLLENSTWDNKGCHYVDRLFPHWISVVKFDPLSPEFISFTTGYGLWRSSNISIKKSKKIIWFFDVQGLEETVPLTILSTNETKNKRLLLSGIGDINGFSHRFLLTKINNQPLGHPFYKNTEYFSFAWLKPTTIIRSGTTYNNDTIHIAYSVDGGDHWKQFSNDPHYTKTDHKYSHVGPIAINASGECVIWCPLQDIPWRTRDFGLHWEKTNGINKYAQIIADTVNPNIFYGWDSLGGTFFLSTDEGRNFECINTNLKIKPNYWGFSEGQFLSIPNKEGGILLLYQNKLIYSTNMGYDWLELVGPKVFYFGIGRSIKKRCDPIIFIYGIMKQSTGIYYSNDFGKKWVKVHCKNNNFPTIRSIVGDMKNPYHFYIGTSGRGLFLGKPRNTLYNLIFSVIELTIRRKARHRS